MYLDDAEWSLLSGLPATKLVKRRFVQPLESDQMTALAGKPNVRRPDRWFAVTDRWRTEGTDNLLAAAVAAGASPSVAESLAGWPCEHQ